MRSKCAANAPKFRAASRTTQHWRFSWLALNLHSRCATTAHNIGARGCKTFFSADGSFSSTLAPKVPKDSASYVLQLGTALHLGKRISFWHLTASATNSVPRIESISCLSRYCSYSLGLSRELDPSWIISRCFWMFLDAKEMNCTPNTNHILLHCASPAMHFSSTCSERTQNGQIYYCLKARGQTDPSGRKQSKGNPIQGQCSYRSTSLALFTFA